MNGPELTNMATITFDKDLLTAIHKHGPDIQPGALADAAGLSRSNIARSLANHRKSELVKAETLTLTPEGARLAGVSLPPPGPAERETENTPSSVTANGSDTSAPLTMAPWDQIRPSGLNYRKTFNQDSIDELAASLLKEGQLQEIVVRRVVPTSDDQFRWEVVAGERRWRAFRDLIDAGKLPKNHPIRIHRKDLDDIEVLEIAVMENRQREDVHPMEEARAIAALQDARVKAGNVSDARAVCREIGEKLGLTERWAQIRVNMVRRLSPKVQQAMMDGVFTSVKWADELGRWPHEMQEQAVEQMNSRWDRITTETELKNWLAGDAVPVGELPFEVDAYVEAGGALSEPDDEGNVQLVNSGLARTLAVKAAETEAEKITADKKYQREHSQESYYSDWSYPAAKDLKPNPPESLHQVLCVIDRHSLKVKHYHPVVKRESYDAWLKKQKTQVTPADGGEPVKALTRGLWKAGAIARTNALREAITDDVNIAKALMILALAPQSSWDATLVRVCRDNPSGDALEIGRGNAHESIILASHLEGFNKNGEVSDRRKALLALIEDPELVDRIFTSMVADLTIDCHWTAGPGAMGEAIAMCDAGYVHNPDGEIVDADWAKKYTKAQQARLIDAYGLFLDTDEISRLKKKDADGQVAEAITSDHHPIEARFVDENKARKLEQKLLNGGKV